MTPFPLPMRETEPSAVVRTLVAKLSKKTGWKVGRENDWLADLAVVLWTTGRQAELEKLGEWLLTEHPFAGSYNAWDGVAHAQAVCARAARKPATALRFGQPIIQHYPNQSLSLRQGKMEDGELALVRLEESRTPVRSAIPVLTGILRAQAFTWVLLQGPLASKYRSLDTKRMEQLVSRAQAELKTALAKAGK